LKCRSIGADHQQTFAVLVLGSVYGARLGAATLALAAVILPLAR
jgi:biotin transporter BioY